MLSSPDDCIIRHPKASRRYGVLSHYKVSFWVPFVFKEVKMIIKEYNYLPEEAIKIRNEVFVKEQGKAYLDEDCPHIWMKKNLGDMGK